MHTRRADAEGAGMHTLQNGGKIGKRIKNLGPWREFWKNSGPSDNKVSRICE